MSKSQRSSSSSRVNMSTRAKSTKKNTGPAAVTPVATYREELESEDKIQTTMTQFAQKWHETTFSSSEGEDEDSELDPDYTTPPTKRKKRLKMDSDSEGENI